MTRLDLFEPEGEPIHPYDLFEILNVLPDLTDVVIVKESPPSESEEDYLRNRHKLGGVIQVGDKKYFQTTSVEPRTKGII